MSLRLRWVKKNADNSRAESSIFLSIFFMKDISFSLKLLFKWFLWAILQDCRRSFTMDCCPVTPSLVFTALVRICLIFQEQEKTDIFLKSDQLRQRGCHSGARSAFYRVLRSLCTITTLSRRSQWMQVELCRLSFLHWRRVEDSVASQRAPYNLLANAKVYAPVEPLLRCRRPYSANMATLRQTIGPSDGVCFEHAQRARRRSAFYVTQRRLLVMPLRCCGGLRSYCAHLVVLHFSWTPWDRRENAVLYFACWVVFIIFVVCEW